MNAKKPSLPGQEVTCSRQRIRCFHCVPPSTYPNLLLFLMTEKEKFKNKHLDSLEVKNIF